MKLTPKEAKKLKASLPSDYIKKIQKKLREKNVDVSDRWVGIVVSGKSPDNSGILDIAIDIAKTEKEAAKQKKQLINSL